MNETNLEVSLNSPLIVWALDADRNITLAEGPGLKRLQFSPQSLVGKNFSTLYQDNTDALKLVDRAFKGEEFTANVVINERLYSTHYIPQFHDKSVTGMTAITVDITDHDRINEEIDRQRSAVRQEKSLLDQVFDKSPAFIAVLKGENFVFENINPAYQALIGDRSVVGKPVEEALPEVKDQGFIELLTKVFQTGETFEGKEVRVLLNRNAESEPEERFVNFVYQRLTNEDGSPLGVYVHGMDLTNEILAKRSLEEAERQQRVFLETMPQMAFIADKNGAITYFNKTWYDYIGDLKNTEGTGWKDKPIHHPDDLERTIQTWSHSVKTGDLYQIEYRLRRHDGMYRWHLGRATPITDSSGQIVRWIGTNTDIHDQKMAQETSRLIIETIPQGIWRTNPDGSADYFSEQFYHLVGYSPEEFLGWGWSQVIIPEDRERVLTEWQKSRNEKKPVSVDFRIKKKDGSIRWFLSLGNPFFSESGELIKYYGTWTDIHEEKVTQELLKENEEKFKTITDAMPQMVWSTLPDGYHDYYNKRWYEYTGMPEGSTDGEEWNNMFHPDDQERAFEVWRESLSTGKPYQIEYRLRHHSGQYRWTLGRALPIRNDKGQIIRWMGTCTDIHDQKKTQAELQEAVKGRDEFLSIASHELKTPLTSLRLMSQLYKKAVQKGRTDFTGPERIQELVDTVDRQVTKLNRLVDDMLDISRIRSGKLMTRMEDVSLGSLVQETLKRMDQHLLDKGYERPVVQLQEEVTGHWDRERIEQVVDNLLTNAIRYGEKKPIRIEVKKEGPFACFSIQDSGIGISKENVNRIFDKFERAINANDVSGLGLGLYISRKIIEAHAGTMSVDSELGKGSTFHFKLPLKG